MTDRTDALLHRLYAIGQSLASSGRGVALIGLGSAGSERDRLDDYSDLDFFAIVEEGMKQAFLEDLGWLERVHPLTYVFRNTPDGYKLLFEDGIFCEMAVFAPGELAQIPFVSGEVVWRAESAPADIAMPTLPLPRQQTQSAEWLLGEALTNLYVGLCRYRRGEKLSALRFIQGFAVDRVLELAQYVEAGQPGWPDPFSAERRFEQRFAKTARNLAAMCPGYSATPEAALAILDWLEQRFEVNAAMKDAIVALSVDAEEPGSSITGLDHVLLAMPAGEEEAARAFYAGLLGLAEETKPEPLASRGGCWFRGTGTVLHLGVEADFRPARKAHPALRVANLAALRRRLLAAGIAVTPDDTLPEVHRFYVFDPFGNRIELIQEGDGFGQ